MTLKTERGTFYGVETMTKDEARAQGFGYAFTTERGADLWLKYGDDIYHYERAALIVD